MSQPKIPAFRHHEARTTREDLHYLLHVPERAREQSMPLLLFLHGAGERGNDLALVKKLGIPALVESGRELPFIAASPQCPSSQVWAHLSSSLHRLLNELCAVQNVDSRRVYLTGVSMGAYGIWKLASETPERFAALVPVCGFADVAWSPSLKNIPTWAFHGALDTIVPAHNTLTMVEALRQLGAPVQVTIFDRLGHECWDEVYRDPEVYRWLLAQSKH